MNNLFKSIILATALMVAGPAFANHAPIPAACAIPEDQFFDSVKNMNAKMRVATDHARDTILTKINDARIKSGMWALEADTFMIGLIQDKGRLLVGVVMFKDHCVVPGTVKVFDANEFIAFITELGLSVDDFVEVSGV